jgi:predicted aspartyl protease
VGLVYVDGELGPDSERLAQVRFLVDRGSLYTVISPRLASELGISLPAETTLEMADGTSVRALVGQAYLRLRAGGDTHEGGILVASMNVRRPLLGVLSLEILRLDVSVIDETLVSRQGHRNPHT